MMNNGSFPPNNSHQLQPDPPRNAQSVVPTNAPRPRKRRRQINSCSGCRRRKSRCDRGLPCGECVKNNHACNYLDDGSGLAQTTSQNRGDTREQEVLISTSVVNSSLSSQELPRCSSAPALAGGDNNEDLAARVDKLEGMLGTYLPVLSQLQSNHATSPTSHANVPTSPAAADVYDYDGEGYLRGKNGRKTEFVSNQHWHALIPLFPEVNLLRSRPPNDPLFYVLNRVFERLHDWAKKQKPVPLALLVPSLSVDTALRALIPSKSVSSVLLNAYLEHFEKIHRVIHIPSFYAEFEDFWRFPDSMSLSWIATLIVILRLGLLVHPNPKSILTGAFPDWNKHIESQGLQLVELFSHLRSSEGRPSLDYVQTQCLLVMARITDGSKAPVAWKLSGQLIQTCLIMGLHQEPMSFSDVVSIFDAEIRRRLWTTTLELHIHVTRVTSMHFSFLDIPYKIQRPSNINDEEISPYATDLPTPHPRMSITDTSFQHALSESLDLRLRLATSTRNDMGLPETAKDHCVDCGLHNRLRLKAPYALSNSRFPGQSNQGQLQQVALDLVRENTFLHYKMASFPKSEGWSRHSKEMVLDTCRSILGLYQHPELSLVQRFILGRWYRNDIITSIICLCLTLRTPQLNSLSEGTMPLTRDPRLEQQSWKLIEDTLSLFAQRRDQTQNEIKEHVLLLLIFSIVKSKGVEVELVGQFRECLGRFEPPVMSSNYTDSSERTSNNVVPRNESLLLDPEMYTPMPENFLEGNMNMMFDIDGFMSDFGPNFMF